eukprot:9965097-Ditylum_brightwellii.AAC.1
MGDANGGLEDDDLAEVLSETELYNIMGHQPTPFIMWRLTCHPPENSLTPPDKTHKDHYKIQI